MYEREKILQPFRENRDWILARVNADIEQHRKGSFRIEVVRKDGTPVSDASVQACLTRHDFQFGCNLFLLDEIEDPAKNRVYQEKYAACFNQATLPFYWTGLEPEEGLLRFGKDAPRLYRRPVPDLCLEWCALNGITPKAHCLNYYSETPNWVPTDPAAFWPVLERRFSQLSQRYAGQIRGWEVTNETLCFHSGKELSRGTSAFYDRDFVERSFHLAERYFPANELIINEAHFNVWGENFKEDRSAYYMQIERALERGARIDTIGLQYHMFFPRETELTAARPYYDPYTIFQLLDRYSDFGKPLQITEITFPAYSEEPADEAIQAELAFWLYNIWFSHPKMETITYWNLIDGYAWSEDNVPGRMTSGENAYYGGLLRFDGTAKPVYDTIYDLIRSRWHTQEQLRTDGAGQCLFRGFYGTYDMTVELNGEVSSHPVHLSKSAKDPLRIVLD